MLIQHAVDRLGTLWKNGLGVQFKVCQSDLEGWSLSTADIPIDVPFSSFPNIARTFCIAEGNGVVLSVNNIEIKCALGELLYFPGDAVVHCKLINGPVKAINLLNSNDIAESHRKVLRIYENTSTAVNTIDNCKEIIAFNGHATISVDGVEIMLESLDAVLGLETTTVFLIQGFIAVC